MGIPHLQHFLQPYATRVDFPSAPSVPLLNRGNHQNPRQSHFIQDQAPKSLATGVRSSQIPKSQQKQRQQQQHRLAVGKHAIIDGPSLAYHVYSIAVARANKITNSRAAPATPSYRDILTVLFAWLDALQQHGFRVAALIFDGALPAAKKRVRIERLAATMRVMQICRAAWQMDDGQRQAHSGHSDSVPPLATIDDESEVFNVVLSSRKGARLPALPFLVPAVIEHLIDSPFAAVTHVVPGEADSYCAAFARTDGGTVFTSDSDLLAYDLGSNGSVMLLKDLELYSSPTGSSLKGQQYELSGIASRFGLRTLQPLAYAVREDHYRGLGECLIHARRLQTDKSADYEVFLSQYDGDHLGAIATSIPSSALSKQLAQLDPRVSEWVHEIRSLSTNGDERPLVVDMYLPAVIEDPSRASPWNHGTNIRQLAYSLLRPNGEHQFSTVEHYRKGERISSTARPHFTASQVEDNLESLHHSLTHAIEFLLDEGYMASWKELGLYWLCMTLDADGKSIPSLDDLRALLVQDVGHSWILIHLSAQIQALLYSWRILKQCLAVYLAHEARSTESKYSSTLLQTISKIKGCRIPQLFDPPSNNQVDEARVRYVLDRICSQLEVQEPADMTPNKRKKRKKNHKAGSSTGRLSAAIHSSNMYNILGSSLAE